MNQIRFRNSTNSPYISGDSISKLADYYVYGRAGIQKLNREKLSRARTIFVNSDRLLNFLEEVDGIELNELTLITGNSDFNFTNPVDLPSAIRMWFCQNNGMPKKNDIFTLPIGIENLRLGRLGHPKWYQPRFKNAITNKILVPPMSPTNSLRFAAVEYAKKNSSLFDVFTNYLHEREYFMLTRNYRFVLCCEGNGFENHRIWETLYQGSFPVMVKSAWALSLQYLELPILFVDSLSDLTEGCLAEFAEVNRGFNPQDHDQLWIPFWSRIIQQRM